MGELSLPKKNADKLHCSYRIYLSIIQEKNTEILVGIYPKIAEDLVESAIKHNYLSTLSHVKDYKREVVVESHSKTVDVEVEVECGTATFSEPTKTTTLKSRFDFTGTDANGRHFIMEVKNVPLADYEDIDAKTRKKKCYDDREINSKVAYFPDGYRKKKTDTVSPRALKHIQELTQLKMNYPDIRCIMCYVIQRNDVQVFQPSVLDPQYREAFKVAMDKGVEIIPLGVEWTKEGDAYLWTDQLPLGNLD
jgi:DNA-binding sugar fermentation-stimulating protein